jgi:VanZ family protein
MLTTIVTASYDEIHQTFIPSRTGRWQDVVLDSCGGFVVQVMIYFLSIHALKLRRAAAPQAELTPTR